MLLKSKAFDVNNKFVVSLDGPAAAGKGTIAHILAAKFGLTYFQSSLVYRKLALVCIKNNIKSTDVETVIKLSQTTQYEPKDDLRDENLGIVASQIAVIPEVRRNLGKYLMQLIETIPRIIMEGRDIGTVIAPSADLKIFIKADINIRAERRYKELCQNTTQNDPIWTFDEVLFQLKIRDKQDTERAIAPLMPSKGALEIDTSLLTPMEVGDKIIEFILWR